MVVTLVDFDSPAQMDHATCPNSGAQTIPTADTVVTVYGWMCHLNTMLLSDTKFQTFRPSVAAAAIVAAARHYSHVLPIWSVRMLPPSCSSMLAGPTRWFSSHKSQRRSCGDALSTSQRMPHVMFGLSTLINFVVSLYDRQAAKVAPSNGGSTVTPQTVCLHEFKRMISYGLLHQKRSRSVVALQYTTPSPQAPTRTAHKVHTADSWHM